VEDHAATESYKYTRKTGMIYTRFLFWVFSTSHCTDYWNHGI